MQAIRTPRALSTRRSRSQDITRPVPKTVHNLPLSRVSSTSCLSMVVLIGRTLSICTEPKAKGESSRSRNTTSELDTARAETQQFKEYCNALGASLATLHWLEAPVGQGTVEQPLRPAPLGPRTGRNEGASTRRSMDLSSSYAIWVGIIEEKQRGPKPDLCLAMRFPGRLVPCSPSDFPAGRSGVPWEGPPACPANPSARAVVWIGTHKSFDTVFEYCYIVDPSIEGATREGLLVPDTPGIRPALDSLVGRGP